MMKRILVWALALIFCLGAAAPSLAANVFAFTERSVTLFEGESAETALKREGVYDGDGEITYTSARESVATVAEDGTITAVGKGQTRVTATLYRDGKRYYQAAINVNVIRAVKKVTLNTTRLTVYDPEDPTVNALMKEAPTHQVIMIPAGTSVNLSTTCTPEDANNRKVTYTSSDAGVAKVTGNSMRAIQRGECELTVASVQNPEVTETFHVLVIQPIKRVQIDAGTKKVAVGSQLELLPVYTPENATNKSVTWTSRNPAIATVDENGVVTGVKKGSVNITAKAADGSNVTGTVMITVTQPVTAITITQDQIPVIVGRSAQARAQVFPNDASDRKVTWSSSDDTIATVRANGQVVGVKAGTCILTCASNSNPEVAAEATIVVSQLVTEVKCVNEASELSLLTGGSVQTKWTALPDDATNKDLTFKSLQPKIATVDDKGRVRALSRGVATIVATAQDAGKKHGSVKINVIQPVTGVNMQRNLYYIQRGRNSSIRAVVEPRNANNQRVYWTSDNERIATVRSNGTSTGSVYGVANGTTTITATTEDGGFEASTRVRVGNFNEAVMVEELYVKGDDEIRITLRNMTKDLTLGRVHFIVECYDIAGNPFFCNTDNESHSFEGDYNGLIYPLERSSRKGFRFKNAQIDRKLGAVVVTVVSWTDGDGYTWTIPEEDRVRSQWSRIEQ